MTLFRRNRTKTIRVRPGENITLRIHVEGEYRVEGDAAEFAEALFDSSMKRLLASKSPERRAEFMRAALA